MYRHHVEGFETDPGIVCRLKQVLGLLRRKRAHLFPTRLRRLHGFGSVAGDQTSITACLRALWSVVWT